MRKMIRESIKTKEVLSANKVAYYSSIGLYDGNDFQGSISRIQFEEIIKPILDQLTIPIQKVLEISGK
jgi:molecular chaperone DnaK (HSP70)